MKNKILVALLTLSLVVALGGNAAAGILGYSLERAGTKGFTEPPEPEPSAAVVAADALIARPVGLGLTIAGTGAYLVTLPMSLSSPGSNYTASEALVVKPFGYTFVRPFGRSDKRFEERTIFGR